MPVFCFKVPMRLLHADGGRRQVVCRRVYPPPYASSRGPARCVTSHLDFDSLCLSTGVLRLALHIRRHYGQKKMRGDEEQVSTIYRS